jgi:transcriptional regulator of acetoin/glycerol metabolism
MSFERVGGARRIRADVRVIAATNGDLQSAISAGSFRSDLFYRLNVFPIEITFSSSTKRGHSSASDPRLIFRHLAKTCQLSTH